MRYAVVIPQSLLGNWINKIGNKEDILDVYVLNNEKVSFFQNLFFKLDQKLFKGGNRLKVTEKIDRKFFVNSIEEISLNENTQCIFNFSNELVRGQVIYQYRLSVNNNSNVFSEVIKSTILSSYKKVFLKVKIENREFTTSLRFDPISVSKNIDLVMDTFLGVLKNNLNDLSNCKAEIEVESTILSLKSILIYCNRFYQKIIDFYFYTDQWLIAYDFVQEGGAKYFCDKRAKKIIPPKDRFWADPIVVLEEEVYYVFIEELLYANNKGYISVFEIHKNGMITKPKKIITNDYHMSYPFVFKYEGNYYMIPETSHNNSVDLYKAKDFPYEWKFEKTIFDKVKAVDTTITYHNKKWWLFTSIKEFENGMYDNVLNIFYSDDPVNGSWKKHNKKTVKNDIENSRQGGPFFKNTKGDLFRVSQNGANTYGYGFNIHRVTELNNNAFKEEDVSCIIPNEEGVIGMHTFNNVEGIRVFDVLKRIKK